MRMPQPLQTQLLVPADRRFLAIIQGHVRELAVITGLATKDILALELASEEAFLNILGHAFPDGTPGEVFLESEIRETELLLVFRDEGLPFDPALVHMPEEKSVGLGLRLIRHAVDEVRWVNRGRRGKELRLVKRLSQPSQCRPSGESQAAVRQAPPQRYDIRLMRPDEAIQVTRIFWLAYGYSYKREDFYHPEGLVHLIGSGLLTSLVAVAENGEVAAHAGLLHPEPVPMAEAALLVVSPVHRGRGLMEALSEALASTAREQGLLGLAVNPVTSHAVSQRGTSQIGGRPCGLDLAACPPRTFKAMGLDRNPPQRESYLHYFIYLATPPEARVYVPDRHRPVVQRIYDSLCRPVLFGEPAQAATCGDYQVSLDRGLSKGTIRVTRADARQWPEILRAATVLLDIAEAVVVDLDLPLAQPASALVCEQAEAAGFFFAGIWPHEASDGDMLRLTYLKDSLDLGQLRLYTRFARELAAYVGAEMKRAAAIGR